MIWEEWVSKYENSASCNERLFWTFHALVSTIAWLREHRAWVERYQFGYGQRAFHYLWYLLIQSLGTGGTPVRVLEIGVFKGQTISLAQLIGRALGIEVSVTAISPLQGNYSPRPLWRHWLRLLADRQFRVQYCLGNLHPQGDYLSDIRRIFRQFDLDLDRVQLLRGLSTDRAIVEATREQRFSLVFIDGDHSFDVAKFDIETYTPLVAPGGYAIIDDAATFLPGRGYFKGMKSVSRACQLLEESPQWRNVLNVGHNRVFLRLTPNREGG
jgi:hypothetical protein